MSQKIGILIVDDSAFMRLLITDILAGDNEIEVLGTANDGKEAVEFVKKKKPDLILMDLMMEEYDGLYATREIMAIRPIPILILSAVGNSNLEPVFEALRLGAVDYMNKPNRNSSKMRLIEDELIFKIKQVFRTARPKSNYIDQTHEYVHVPTKAYVTFDIVVIGASTGGPTAVEQVVKSLPDNFPIPVVIVQHMPANFIPSFVQRLNSLSPLKVKMGIKGATLEAGVTYVAPGDANIAVESNELTGKLTISYDSKVYREYNEPSINALFTSVAKLKEINSLSVLLTGMGKDGVKGLEKIKASGGRVLVQDEESCVIFGMPKAAINAGVVDEVLPLYQIAPRIIKLLSE